MPCAMPFCSVHGCRALIGACKPIDAVSFSRWRRNGDVCENYMPHKVAPTCTGLPFYHWGALTGFISLLDAGLY